MTPSEIFFQRYCQNFEGRNPAIFGGGGGGAADKKWNYPRSIDGKHASGAKPGKKVEPMSIQVPENMQVVP